MSNTVDDRIVSMQFDNAQFEKAVGQTITTLGNLDKALQLEDGAKGFANLNKAAGTVSFSKIQNGIESLQDSFSLWGVVARRAVENVVDMVEGKLVSAIKKVTLDPINDGFNEYNLKMGSIQTIMASTGENLRTVKGYLEELNAYSDQTIYSFSDMTNNIGKFTNAGVKLEDAVAAIKGISNEAAISGANANEASRAMYNFSQALSSGYVKLIDWKSIENANMATVGFKDALLETAVAMKTAKKNADGTFQILTADNNGKTMKEAVSATKNFNDSLSHQWMTTEVLTQTLRQYATDVRTLTKDEKKKYEADLKALGYTEVQIKNIEHLGIKAADAATEVKTYGMMVDALMEAIGSGWATTFELIIGDFEQAKKMWTSVNNVLSGIVDSASDARNQFLKGVLGNNLFDSEWQHLKDLGIVTDDFRKKLKELAAKGGWDLDALTKKYGSFEATLQAGWLSAEMLGDAIEATNGKIKKDSHELTKYGEAVESSALFSVKHDDRMKKLVDSGYSLNTIYGLIKAQVRGYDISQGELTEEQIKSITAVEAEQKALKELSKTAENADMSMSEVSDTLQTFTSGLYDNRFSGRDAVLATLGNAFKSIGQIITSVKDAIGDVFTLVSPQVLNGYLLYISELSEGLELTEEQMHAIRSIAGKLLRPIKELSDGFRDWLANMAMPATFELFGAGFDLFKGGMYVLGDLADHTADRMGELRGYFKENIFGPLGKQLEIHVLPRWQTFREFLRHIPEEYEKLKDTLATSTDFQGMGRQFQYIYDQYGNLVEYTKTNGSDGWGLISWAKFYKKAVTQVLDGIGKAILDNTQIDDYLLPHWERLSDFVNNLTITKFFKDAGREFKAFGTAMSNMDMENLPSIFSSVQTNVGLLGTQLKGVIDKYTGFFTFFENGMASIWDTFRQQPLVDAFASSFNTFGDTLKRLPKHLQRMGKFDLGFITDYTGAAFDILKKNIWDAISRFTLLDETLNEVKQVIGELPFVKAANKMRKMIKQSWTLETLATNITHAWDDVKDAFGRLKDIFGEVWNIFKRGPFTTLPQTLPMLANGFKDLFTTIKDALGGLNIGQILFEGLNVEAKQALDFVFGPDNAASQFIDKLATIDFKGMFAELKTQGGRAFDALTGKSMAWLTLPGSVGFTTVLDNMLMRLGEALKIFDQMRDTVKKFTGLELPFSSQKFADAIKGSRSFIQAMDFQGFFADAGKHVNKFFGSIGRIWTDRIKSGFGIKKGMFLEVFFNSLKDTRRKLGDLITDLGKDFLNNFNPGADNFFMKMFDIKDPRDLMLSITRKLTSALYTVTKPIDLIGFVFTDLERGARNAFGFIGNAIADAIKPFIDLRKISFDVQIAWKIFNQVTEFALKPFLSWNNDIEFGKRLEWLKVQYGNFFKYIIDSIKKYSQLDELFAALKERLGLFGKQLGDVGGKGVGLLGTALGGLGKVIKYLWDQLANSVLGKFLKPIFLADFVLRDIIASVKNFVTHMSGLFHIFDKVGDKLSFSTKFKLIVDQFKQLFTGIGNAFLNNSPVDTYVEFIRGKFKALHDWLAQFQWFQNLETFVKTNEVMIIFIKVIKAVGKALKEIFTSSVEAGGFFHLLYNILSSIASIVFDRVCKALDRLESNFKVLKDRAGELSKGSGFGLLFNVFNFLADALLALAGVDLSGFNKVNLAVFDGIKKLAGGVKNILGSLFSFNGLMTAAGPAFKRFGAAFKMVTSAEIPFGEKLKLLYDVVARFFRSLVGGLVINDKLKTVLFTLGGIVHSLGGAFLSIVAIHIPNLFTKIVDAVGPFLEQLKLKDRLYAFADGVKTLFDKIQNGGAVEFIIEKFKALVDAVKNFFDLSAIDFNGFAGENTLFGSVSKFIDTFKGFGMSDKQLDAFHKFLDSLGGAGNSLNDVLAQFGIKPDKLSGLLGLFQAIGKIKVMFSAADFIADVAGVFKVGKSLSGMFDSFGAAADAYKKNLKGQSFKNMATGILMIAGALALLALINPKRLVPVAISMAVVLAAVGFLFKELANLKAISAQTGEAPMSPLQSLADGVKDVLSKFVKIAAIGVAVLGVALGLVLFAKAILMFTDIITGGKCAVGIIAAIAVVAGLVLIAKMLGKVSQGLTGLGTAFLGLAAAVWIISTTMDRFSEIDPSAVWNALKVALGISALIAGLMIIRSATNTDLTGLAGTIVGIAAAVFIMSFAVAKLGKMGLWPLIKGLGALGLMLFFMTKSLKDLGSLPMDESGAAVSKAAEALTSIAKEMKSLALVMSLLALIPTDMLVKGFVALIAPMFAIGVGLKLMSRYVAGANKNAEALNSAAKAIAMVAAVMVVLSIVPGDMLKKGAIALLGVAVAMGIIMVAAKKFTGGVDWKALASLSAFIGVLVLAMVVLGKLLTGDQAWVGFLGMLGVMAVAVGALWALSKIGPAIAPTTAALVALAAAFGILTLAMFLIGKLMTGEQLAQGLIGIFFPLVMLIGALGLLSLMSGGIFAVGMGFLFLGGGLLMAAAAVGIFCGLFPGLVASIIDAAPAVVEALANLGGKIAGWFKGIGDWIGNKIRGDADESKAEANKTASEVKESVKKNNAEIERILNERTNQNGGTTMAEKIRKDGAEAVAAADETTPILEEKLGKLSTAFTLPSDGEDKSNTLADAVHALTGNASTAIDEDTPGLQEKAKELFGALSGEGMDTEALTTGTNIKETLLGSLSDPAAFEGVSTENIGSYLSGMTSGLENTDITPLAKGIGLDVDTGMKDGVEENSSLVTNVLSSLASSMISTTRTGLDSASPSQEFHNIGMDTALGLRNGLNEGAPLVKSAMETFTAGLIAKGLESPDKMAKAATKSMSGYVKAISDKGKDAKKASETAATNAASAANKYTNFYTTGRHCVQGLIDGIRSKTNEAKQAARELGNAVSSATSGSVEVRSPSRVFMRIGAFIVAGLVKGIVDNTKSAARAASDMGDDTISAVASAMATLGKIADEDINYTPTITPVVDLSAARFGFSRLNTMSDNLQMSIDGAINSKWSQLDAMYDRLNGMTVGTDNSDVVASINSLKADIAMLGESVANMKVVLNRKVVGQIDNGLGQQQLLANRGV